MLETQRMKEIVIKEGEVASIKDANGNILWQKCEYTVIPLNDNNALPVAVINVSKGDVITIYYYLTNAGGYMYDGSNCGCGSFNASSLSSSELNVHGVKTLTATSSGKLIIAGRYSNYQWGIDWPGSLAISPPYGDYIRVKIN